MHLDITHSLLFPGIYCLHGTLPPKDASAPFILPCFRDVCFSLGSPGGVYFPLYSLEFNSMVRSLAGYSPWSCKEPDTTEQLNSSSTLFGGSVVKSLPAKHSHRSDPCVGKVSWRRRWLLTPVFVPGESHEQGAWWVAKTRTRRLSD